MRVLVIVSYKPDMMPEIEAKSQACLKQIPTFSPATETKPTVSIDVFEQRKPFPSEESDCTPWSKVTRVRNHTLDVCGWENYDALLWIDGDIVDYPPNMPDLLVEANYCGVTAPLVLVEKKRTFYDRSAFIIHGTCHVEPTHRFPFLHGRNLSDHEPYWTYTPKENLVDMDCVGSVTLVNTDIYREGARYEDHPAFTDHFPICQRALQLGRRVLCRRDVIAYHADLPKYGEAWH
jgi:hypothetical protein